MRLLHKILIATAVVGGGAVVATAVHAAVAKKDATASTKKLGFTAAQVKEVEETVTRVLATSIDVAELTPLATDLEAAGFSDLAARVSTKLPPSTGQRGSRVGRLV